MMGLLDFAKVISRTGFRSQVLHSLKEERLVDLKSRRIIFSENACFFFFVWFGQKCSL